MAIRTTRQFLFSSHLGTVRASEPQRADIPYDELVHRIRLAILEQRWPNHGKTVQSRRGACGYSISGSENTVRDIKKPRII